MQVSTSVDEADIGRIREGQAADFTVDAFGTRKFNGQVTQIRKAGKTLQNVVTYTVIISADNPDLSLMPGMTANVDIQLLKKTQVLAVANAALRFKPPDVRNDDDGGLRAETRTDLQAGSQRGRTDPEERIRRLTEALDLTPAQQDGLRAVFKDIREKMKAARQTGEAG
ncbi:MAG: efflux RND transporter periplasmic adaptor subunit, partial [Gammaproteobacteria bacterium]